jgi:homopolymeric O-antigen transport system permease protein
MIKNLVSGAKKYPIWTRLALDDIASINRRSIFGFFWEPVSYIFMVAVLSPLYALLMNMDFEWYVVYFSGGWLVWRFMSGLIGASCSTYIGVARYITQTKQPFSIYSYKLVLSHIYRLLLNLPVFIGIMLVYSDITQINIVGVLFAIFLFSVMGFSLSIVIGYITLKVRDIQAVVENIMRIAFFVTPVIWVDKMAVDLSAGNLNIAAKAAYLDFNPLYHYLIVMREPLLGEPISIASLNIVIVSTVISLITSIVVLKKFQHNIPYLV